MNNIEEIICEAIQDDCIGHCNHPYNYVYFDLSLDEAYPTYEAAEKDLIKRRIK